MPPDPLSVQSPTPIVGGAIAGFVGRVGGAIASWKSGDCRESGADMRGTAAVDTPRAIVFCSAPSRFETAKPNPLKAPDGAVSDGRDVARAELEIIKVAYTHY